MQFMRNKHWATTQIGTALLLAVASASGETHARAVGDVQPTTSGFAYTIAKDETLSAIASRFTSDSRNWRAIGRANQIGNDRRMPIGSLVIIPAKLLPEKAAIATITAVHGDVSILGKDGVIIPAEIGRPLSEGAMIATSAGGFITLSLADQTHVSLPPASSLQLTTMRIKEYINKPRTAFTLENGRVESRVTPFKMPDTHYEIRTPLAVAGVRGTQFRVSYDGNTTRDEVLQGTVNVASPGQPGAARFAKDVTANYGTVVADGQILPPIVLPEPPLLADGYERQQQLPIRFGLSQSKAVAFRVRISQDADGLNPVAETTVPNESAISFAKFSDLDDGSYYVRVSSIDSHGLEGKTSNNPFILKARPFAPLQIAPGAKQRSAADGNAANVVAVTFKWAEVSDAVSYHLQIDSDPAFKQAIIDRSDVKGDALSVPNLHEGTFYWRVATITGTHDNPDQGPYGDVKKLEILPSQAAPLASEAEDGMHFSWRGEPGQTFVFETARAVDFAVPLQQLQTKEPHVEFPVPAAGIYYARIRSIDADGYQGGFSPAQKFEVITRWKTGYGASWNADGIPVKSDF